MDQWFEVLRNDSFVRLCVSHDCSKEYQSGQTIFQSIEFSIWLHKTILAMIWARVYSIVLVACTQHGIEPWKPH